MQGKMGLQAAQHGDGTAQHADRVASATVDRYVGKHRTIARAAAAEGADIAGEADHRRADQRLGGGKTEVAQHVGDGKTVGGVDDEIGRLDQCAGILRRQAHDMPFEAHLGIEAVQRLPSRFDLRPSDIGHAVERLAMEVGDLDRVVIDQDDAADPRPHQILQHRAAEAARADHHHGGRRQAGLPFGPDLTQDRLACVSITHDAPRS